MTLSEAVEQSSIVLAIVGGKPITEVPGDLFIPPDALEILLESFTGPLDLLLYLIRKQNIDILNIPIAHITRQYLQYIQLMEEKRLELAADYLVMAAMLAEIKSRMLLPVSTENAEDSEEDPRLVLVRKLQQYEQFKKAAENIDTLARCDREFFRFALQADGLQTLKMHPSVELSSLVIAMQELIIRQGHEVHHQIKREPLSIRERMTAVLARLQQDKIVPFEQLYNKREGRMGLAVTLMAILELARESLLIIIQPTAYAPIYLQAIDHG